MTGGETDVIGRMPILCRGDDFVVWLNAIDDRDDFVASGNGQCAAGEKFVLDVNND
jgi:hypothetical protein